MHSKKTSDISPLIFLCGILIVFRQRILAIYSPIIFNCCARQPLYTKISDKYVIKSIGWGVFNHSFLAIKFDPCLGLRVLINMSLFTNVPRWIIEVSNHLKTKEMCDEAVRMEPYSLEFVPDRLKTEDMCIEAVRRKPYTLRLVPDHLKTQGTCEKAVALSPYTLKFVPDRFKTQEMSDAVVMKDPCA